MSYPLHLDLRGRRVLVVGAGPVGQRRAASAAAAGGVVDVVALEAGDGLPWPVERRAFRASDVDGAWLVLACTGTVDDQVAAACEKARTWCVRADVGAESAAAVPAVLRSGDVTVSVSAGRDPRRAIRLRDAVGLALDSGTLPLRRSRPGPGSVALVGGGPGDPGLLTVRARQLLAEADVVVRDRLAPVVDLADDVEVVETGKQAHGPSWSQREIEQLVLDRARAGLRVVRLKGGDVHVFARGIEEVAAVLDAGLPVEVVPGVSSALAVPTAAGIPVTAKGITQSVTVVSAHAAPGSPESTVDWDALAGLGGTLVLLMAVERIASCCAALVAGGLAASTPLAVVQEGTLASQAVVVTTVGEAAGDTADVTPPAVVVIGEVVALRRTP